MRSSHLSSSASPRRVPLVSLLALGLAVGLYCGTSETLAPTAPGISADSFSPVSKEAALTATFIRDRQREADKNSAFHFSSSGDTQLANHPSQGLRASLGTAGLRLELGSDHLELSLRSTGCSQGLRPEMEKTRPVSPALARNRAEYRRADLTEWYTNGPLGLEQGFDFPKRPACNSNGPLRVEMSLGGSLKPQAQGQELKFFAKDAAKNHAPLLRYGSLYAHDADGKQLPSALQLNADGSLLALLVDDSGARYPVSIDPLMQTEAASFTASDKSADSYFGISVAVSADGSRAIIGAFLANPDAVNEAGAAYVYSRDLLGMWTEEKILSASDKSANAFFGRSVAMSADGSRVVVGAPDADPGAVTNAGQAYVFTRSPTGMWTEEKILSASVRSPSAEFGFSVGMSADGTRVVVGASSDKSGAVSFAGQAYVFTRSLTGMWTEEKILSASDKSANASFGQSVAISADGSRAVVGSYNATSGTFSSAGQAYVFTRSTAGMWDEEKLLSASDKSANASFGFSVAVSADGSRAVVGAPTAKSGTFSQAGQAYVFSRDGLGAWTEEQILSASDRNTNSFFGQSVAISADGSKLAVAAYRANVGLTTSVGQVYLSTRSVAGMWTETTIFSASDKKVGDGLGGSAAMSADGGQIVAGAYTATRGSPAVSLCGAVYIFNTVLKANGQPCTLGAECLSGSCADGLCCDTACGGSNDADCQACAAAKKQSGTGDGTCGPAKSTIACRPANTAVGPCDVAELCDGSTTACPMDLFATSGTCRSAVAGGCDLPESCDGSGAACPMDKFVDANTECRPAVAGGCDVAEKCTGLTNACPMDKFALINTECRAAVPGGCDVAEKCDGLTSACPMDKVADANTECRPAVSGGCDVAEKCTGTSNACPKDDFVAANTECRPAASGGCDVAEKCTGTSNACPMDQFVPASDAKVCRASVGLCDKPETCNGLAATCPTNVLYQPADMFVCRPKIPSNDCSVDSYCTGSGPGCQTAVAAAGISCRKTISGTLMCGKCNSSGSCVGTFTTSADGSTCP